ncbi:hypothetical protein BST61_g9197 [Cercospora zeina]
MATASPAKNYRIERHIQRLRGAGVRSLATSFGFSFGLPVAAPVNPALESTHNHERPTKRRKSNEVVAAPEPESKRTASKDDVEAPENVAAEVESQRLLAAHDEELEGLARGQAEEDSSSNTRVAPKKAVKGVHGAKDVSAAGAKVSAKKRGRPKKAVDAEDAEKDVAPDVAADRAMAVTAAQAAMGLSSTISADAEAKATSPDVTKPATKRRGRPRKNAPSDAAPSSTPVPVEEPKLQPPARPKRHAATTAMTKVSEGFSEEESDITKKRRAEVPKPVSQTRQKMKLGVSEPTIDMSDGDQATPHDRNINDNQPTSDPQHRQRAPETVRRRAKQRPAADIEETAERSGDVAAVVRKPKKAASESRAEILGSVEGTAQAVNPKSTADVKPRRRAAAIAQSKVSEASIEEAGDISKKRCEPESSTGVGKSQEKSSARSKTSDKRDVQAGSAGNLHGLPVATEGEDEKQETQTTRSNRKLSYERRPLAETEVNLRSVSPAKNSPDGTEKQLKHTVQKLVIPRKTALKASVNGGTRTAPAKKSKASKIFVDDDAAHSVEAPQNNATYHSPVLLLGSEASINSSKTPSVEQGSSGDACAEVHSKKQEASKKHHKPDVRDVANLSSKTLWTADGTKDVNEDVDWLFEVPKPSAPKRRVARQPPLPRQERKRVADASEIDLDDLLSNIATFVLSTNASQTPPVQARAIKNRK